MTNYKRKRAVIVMNVITETKTTFFNSLPLEDNLISAIISSSEDSRKVMEFNYRNNISAEAKIEVIPSKNGSLKAYSQAFDMIAYEG